MPRSNFGSRIAIHACMHACKIGSRIAMYTCILESIGSAQEWLCMHAYMRERLKNGYACKISSKLSLHAHIRERPPHKRLFMHNLLVVRAKSAQKWWCMQDWLKNGDICMHACKISSKLAMYACIHAILAQKWWCTHMIRSKIAIHSKIRLRSSMDSCSCMLNNWYVCQDHLNPCRACQDRLKKQ